MGIISTDHLRDYVRVEGGTDAGTLAMLAGLANDLVADAWADPVDPVPARVRALTLEVAARAYFNPRGYSSRTRTLDDGSITDRIPDARARAGVYLTDEEKADLQGSRWTGGFSGSFRYA